MLFFSNQLLPRTFATFALAFALAAGAAAQPPGTDQPSRAVMPERLSASFAEVTKRVEPAVVSIDTKSKVPETTARTQPKSDDSDEVMDFFRRQLPRRPMYSVGSGFIVDKAGYLITNEHVIDDASKITVKLTTGEEFPGRVVGVDIETDLAVVKIDAGRDLPFIKLGDSEAIEVGDWVLALGSPFGLTRSVTAGIISQTKRETPKASIFQKFIQTDAAINRGNSGGPLVNMAGEVIGVNSQIATATGDYNGVGFALPSNEVRSVYEQIIRDGRVRRGFLGVTLDTVKAEFSAVYGLKEGRGAIVTDVRDATPAAAAGLKVGDVIVRFDDKPIQSAQDLIAKVSATAPDRTVGIVFYRENGAALDQQTASLRLAERPAVAVDQDSGRTKLPVDQPKAEAKPFGLTLTELTPPLAASYKLEGQKGLIVKEISPDSFIADIKAADGEDALGEGDVIQRINRQAVTDAKMFAETVAKLKKGDPVVLHVLALRRNPRGPQLRIVQFTVQ